MPLSEFLGRCSRASAQLHFLVLVAVVLSKTFMLASYSAVDGFRLKMFRSHDSVAGMDDDLDRSRHDFVASASADEETTGLETLLSEGRT